MRCWTFLAIVQKLSDWNLETGKSVVYNLLLGRVDQTLSALREHVRCIGLPLAWKSVDMRIIVASSVFDRLYLKLSTSQLLIPAVKHRIFDCGLWILQISRSFPFAQLGRKFDESKHRLQYRCFAFNTHANEQIAFYVEICSCVFRWKRKRCKIGASSLAL